MLALVLTQVLLFLMEVEPEELLVHVLLAHSVELVDFRIDQLEEAAAVVVLISGSRLHSWAQARHSGLLVAVLCSLQ